MSYFINWKQKKIVIYTQFSSIYFLLMPTPVGKA